MIIKVTYKIIFYLNGLVQINQLLMQIILFFALILQF